MAEQNFISNIKMSALIVSFALTLTLLPTFDYFAYADTVSEQGNSNVEIADLDDEKPAFEQRGDINAEVSAVVFDDSFVENDSQISENSQAYPEDVIDLDYDFSPIDVIDSKEPSALRIDRVDFQQAQEYAATLYNNLRELSKFENKENSIHRDELYTFDDKNETGMSLDESNKIGDAYKTKNHNGILVGKYLVDDVSARNWNVSDDLSLNAAVSIAGCVAQCFENDYPELTFDFDFFGGSFTTVVLKEYDKSGIIGLIWVSSSKGSASSWPFDARKPDWKSESDIRNAYSKIESTVSMLAKQASALDTDYEKLSLFNDWLIDNNTYADDTDAPLAHCVASALAGIGEPVCQGYAEAFFVLCKAAGIPCATIVGSSFGGRHEWNVVKIDGKWYLVDVTWNDGDYESSGNFDSARKTWFLIGSDEDSGSHVSCDDSWGAGWFDNNEFYVARVHFDNHPQIEKDNYRFYELADETLDAMGFELSSTLAANEVTVSNHNPVKSQMESDITEDEVFVNNDEHATGNALEFSSFISDFDSTPVEKSASTSPVDTGSSPDFPIGIVLLSFLVLSSCILSLKNASKHRLI